MRRILTCTILATALPLGTTEAQGRPLELGTGLGVIAFQSGGGSQAIQVQTGWGSIYLGVPLGDRLAFEPAFGLDFTHVDDFDLVVAGFTFGLPIYFRSQRRGLFVAPFAGFSFINASASGVGDSDLQVSFGTSVGSKFPVGQRASIRLELPLAYSLESEYRVNAFTIGASLGVALFLGGR